MNSSSRNGARVIWLAVHTTEGMMRVQTLRDWTAWPGSSHASSDETGALWGPEKGFVPYSLASWTLRNGNSISENIEQCGWAKWKREDWLARPLLLDATARWLAERSRARGIPLRRLTHAEIRARVPGVLGHGDYSVATGDGTHTDPGPNYPWDVVLAKANAYASGTQEDTVSMEEVVQSWYGPRFKDSRNYAQVVHNIEDQIVAANTQIAGLSAAVAKLAAAVASGSDDLTAAELTDAVDEGIRRGGAAVLAAQEAARQGDLT